MQLNTKFQCFLNLGHSMWRQPECQVVHIFISHLNFKDMHTFKILKTKYSKVMDYFNNRPLLTSTRSNINDLLNSNFTTRTPLNEKYCRMWNGILNTP